ncbi:hypothetical protein PACTADRAFT_75014 [Pachysolen tannophilus NRRL Y-2460]|uniref:Importin N-terminal domain-containing protein n=1 Tax=Pachysolen tannophilus NRRL Y-2460 TaxID=669874 RepID=A0A1E4TVV4_PACTA|nr:hypothetical protein PACTADRAFT_75014 [Pachysolen tannophilus NRRL Y-2460]
MSNGTITLEALQQALQTMYSNVSNDVKHQANNYLENFQKSQEAWNVVFEVLNNSSSSPDLLLLKMFCAQTLRSKISYDLHQLPRESLQGLKDSIINLIITYERQSQKIIFVQLCVSLANFALQFLEWKNCIEEVISKFSSSNCLISMLEFLKVLPEELSDVKKTPLTDEEFMKRVHELITDNVKKVLLVLSELSNNRSANPPQINSLILEVINSWIKEIPVERILSINSIASLIFESITQDDTFETSIECLCTIIRETGCIQQSDIMRALCQQLLNLKVFLVENKDDPEKIEGLTRLFSEAGDSWHALIALSPKEFKPLVEIILELTAYDEDLDVVKYTFYFWYQLKQMLILENFKEARLEFSDIYLKLVAVIIKHLQYPISQSNPSSTNTTELFNGDRELEDKFKDFRYDMGDILKDCCAVVGSETALSIPFQQIQAYCASPSQMPWQQIEAPLFSLRAMAKEVDPNENKIMPEIMKLLIQLPENNKIRYAATLVLGRYTEWTAKHPEFLEVQLNYITNGFQVASKDVKTAAAHALMYFCQDCSALLVNYLEQLFEFYNNVSDSLDLTSLYEVTDGIAHILKEIDDDDKLYHIASMFWGPTLEKLNGYLNLNQISDEINTKIADEIELITIYVGVLRAKNFRSQISSSIATNPISKLVIETCWPIVSKLVNKYGHSLKVSERCLKFVKATVVSLGIYITPILPEIEHLLIHGFKKFKFGCYLWVSGIVIREISHSNYNELKESIWKFSYQQSINFIEFLNNSSSPQTTVAKEFPDLIEDFFRMANDILMFYPSNFIADENLLSKVYDVAIMSLSNIDNFDPLIATLHFLIDLYSWGFENIPISFFDADEEQISKDTLLKTRTNLLNFARVTGANLTVFLLNGLVFRFPVDCILDASDLLTKILKLSSNDEEAITWLDNALKSLDNVSEKERMKLLGNVKVAINNGDFRRVRTSIKDFVNWYTRKNIRSSNLTA